MKFLKLTDNVILNLECIGKNIYKGYILCDKIYTDEVDDSLSELMEDGILPVDTIIRKSYDRHNVRYNLIRRTA